MNSMRFPRTCYKLGSAPVISAALITLLAGTVAFAQPSSPANDRDRWRQLQRGDEDRATNRRAASPSQQFRSYDGTGNNLARANWGAANSDYLRERSGAHYADRISAPAGANRPSARAISNALAAQGDVSTADERGLSTAIYEFGQFLDHDIGLAKGGSSERFDISVPRGDTWFDPASTGSKLIYMDRSAFDPATGTTSAREQINTVTAFIDASQIYGTDSSRAAWLRTYSGGRLKTRVVANSVLLPLNDGTQANDNPVGASATTLVVAGDVRANEQPGLTTLHTVFLREHNAQADRLARLHREWDDERLYQEARRCVAAEMQVITFNEFLPALLGHKLPEYRGYNPRVNPGLSNAFATAAYRFGHSQVGPDIGVLNENFEEVASLDLADIFFNPSVIASIGGIDPIVRYMATDTAQHVDNMIVDPLRNFLFGPPGSGGFDLAALNIQRGRDHGLGSYNDIRADFNLPRFRSFSQITSNAALAATLQNIYGTVDNIDAWVGILAEDHIRGGSVGPTADAVISDQFTRLRDGDRFWYQNDSFEPRERASIEGTTLSDIITRNSGVTALQKRVFFAASLSEPCVADFDHNGTVDSADQRSFHAAFVNHEETADLNHDGSVDILDWNFFITHLRSGC